MKFKQLFFLGAFALCSGSAFAQSGAYVDFDGQKVPTGATVTISKPCEKDAWGGDKYTIDSHYAAYSGNGSTNGSFPATFERISHKGDPQVTFEFCTENCVSNQGKDKLSGTLPFTNGKAEAPGIYIIHMHISSQLAATATDESPVDVSTKLSIGDFYSATLVYSFKKNDITGIDPVHVQEVRLITAPGTPAVLQYESRGKNLRLELVNILGQRILDTALPSGNAAYTFPRVLPEGIYILRLSENGKPVFTQKYRM